MHYRSKVLGWKDCYKGFEKSLFMLTKDIVFVVKYSVLNIFTI